MNADDLDIFIEKSNLIKLNLDKFNSDNDDINKIKIFVNSYIDKFEKLTIDELEEYSNKFKSLRVLIKKIEYPKNTLLELNDIVTKLIDFNNDLIMSIIISNL